MRKSLAIFFGLLLIPAAAMAQDEWEDTDTTDTFAEEAPPAETSSPQPEASASASAGPVDKGTKGLSFGVPSGGGPTFGMAYFLGPDTAVRADLGFALISTDPGMGADRSTVWGFSIEAGYRMYKPVVGRLTTFVQPSFFIAKAAQDGDFGALLTVALTAGLGVEYWITDQFTLSGQTGGGLQFSNEFKNIALTTGTSALYASWYW